MIAQGSENGVGQGVKWNSELKKAVNGGGGKWRKRKKD